jgi:hypothetical protein
MLRLCSGSVQALFRLCSGSAQAYSGSDQVRSPSAQVYSPLAQVKAAATYSLPETKTEPVTGKINPEYMGIAYFTEHTKVKRGGAISLVTYPVVRHFPTSSIMVNSSVSKQITGTD